MPSHQYFWLQKKSKQQALPFSTDDSSIKLDVASLSSKARARLFAQESPEFAGVLADFDARAAEARDRLQPVVALVDAGKLPDGPAAKLIRIRLHLCLK
jgi:hypothetical protein